MIYFLLIIGFIIDGVIVLGLMTLFTKMKKTEELELRQKEVAAEIEDLFSSYLLELKEENKRLEGKLVQPVKTETVFREHETAYEREDYHPPEPMETEELYRPSRSSQVISRYNRGVPIELIAKELNIGKTEAQLILKFQEKN
ncbi:hypothetical protein LF817_07650 [Halobacillus sp. A1]|uniref:hypothetical protein n=1 Tax=Halobacillus sp. A1 TaxID=2880262 RepID=UPI0020A66BC1|nr:hypothetical protein [Halobacillus sp. A1]MCP3031220.1 hypothetical protein [Halobacillus sp. A1]